MNRNPNIIAMIPIIIAAIENMSKACLILNPMNRDEIPKNRRLKPTIIETNSDENMGNNMKIKPNIIDKIPAPLYTPILSPPFL